ncbi:MAG TPA: hypothetical protein VFZ40_01355 [Pyrinomonadaceae bacterium]
MQNVQVALIAAALKAAKNKGYTVKAFPRLNHLFQTATTGLPSEYGKIDMTRRRDYVAGSPGYDLGLDYQANKVRRLLTAAVQFRFNLS